MATNTYTVSNLRLTLKTARVVIMVWLRHQSQSKLEPVCLSLLLSHTHTHTHTHTRVRQRRSNTEGKTAAVYCQSDNVVGWLPHFSIFFFFGFNRWSLTLPPPLTWTQVLHRLKLAPALQNTHFANTLMDGFVRKIETQLQICQCNNWPCKKNRSKKKNGQESDFSVGLWHLVS